MFYQMARDSLLAWRCLQRLQAVRLLWDRIDHGVDSDSLHTECLTGILVTIVAQYHPETQRYLVKPYALEIP